MKTGNIPAIIIAVAGIAVAGAALWTGSVWLALAAGITIMIPLCVIR